MDTKLCGHCKEPKPLDAFPPSQLAKAGGWCSGCRTIYYREKLGRNPREVIPVVDGHFRCGSCKEFKTPDEFTPSQRKTGAWCRDCASKSNKAKRPERPDGFGTCAQCGDEIPDAKDRRRRFCSSACKASAAYWRRNPRAQRTCDDCGVDITMMRSHARYCSDKCAQHAKNSTRTPEYRRAVKLWAAYKITLEDYDGMVAEQSNRCAICGSDDPKTHHGFWQVDHCHDSEAVRGLLCNSCNMGLGYFYDRTETLSAAIDYLNQSRKGPCS